MLGTLFYSSEAVQPSFPKVHPTQGATSWQNNKTIHLCYALLAFSLQSPIFGLIDENYDWATCIRSNLADAKKLLPTFDSRDDT